MFGLFKLFISILLVFNSLSANAQNTGLQKFENKLKLSELLLSKQFSREDLTNAAPSGLKVVALKEHEYIFKDKFGSTITAHLHIESLKVVYVEFEESLSVQHELYEYLLDTKNFELLGTEHNCDYLNNKIISISLCPGNGDGITVQVTKYQM